MLTDPDPCLRALDDTNEDLLGAVRACGALCFIDSVIAAGALLFAPLPFCTSAGGRLLPGTVPAGCRAGLERSALHRGCNRSR